MAVHFSSTNSAPATPKRRRMSPGSDGNDWGLTWGWTTPATPGDSPLQDDDLFQSPEACSGRGGNFNSAENKRGRPRADMITGLIEEGAVSPSAIKCKFCSRVFPREKSLQAHLRTHTGERPYDCDYPGCTRAFTQSGQLKTHQRLHTGEKPFRCSELNCPSRFTHANRHCPDHPNALLRRSNDFVLQPVANTEEPSEVRKWLEKYLQRQQEETPPVSKKASPRPAAPPASPKKQSKARKGLMSEVEQQENTTPKGENVATPTVNPLSAEKPKRRWLREAGLEGVLLATAAADAGLARPIKWSETEESSPVQAANLMRPSVLMLASTRAPEEEWLGAMALVALANNQKVNMQNQPLDLASPNYTNL